MKKVQIGSKFYDAEVKKGIRYIDGKTVDEFARTLNKADIAKMVTVGKMAVEDELTGTNPPKGKYQYYSI